MAVLLKLRKTCMFLCAGLVFVYLSVLCYAYPTRELIFAIAFELFFFALYLYLGRRRAASSAGQAGATVISELSSQYAIVHQSRRLLLGGTTLFWLATTLALTVDCFAYCSAFAGQTNVSLAVYRAVPVSGSLGFHPGASLEVLAGAYVEARKYAQALPLYEEIEKLRLATFGPTHKEIAALYCDYGDLYTHQNRLPLAESYFRRALTISTALLGDRGSGRAFTRLADCLRDQGRYDEATRQYRIAYDMRMRQFGPSSAKVGETLSEWARLCRLQGLNEEADRLQARATKIEKLQPKSNPILSGILSLALFLVSLYVSNFFLGRKGVLTELVVNRMKATVEAGDADESKAGTAGDAMLDARSKLAVRKRLLSRLITLCRFQKKNEEADHYAALLLALNKE
ncbi:MAG: tetratricopeptide repeat protein [Cyanobacteria bacterium SZAS LIN-3]|nr:tetratricopeptide repeat protein [Cyanobacteria bacterium SZAS LIN-3]